MRDDKLRLLALCGYPSELRPTHQPFVRELLCALAAQGAEPTVIAPESVWHAARAGRRLPRSEQRDGLAVQRPRFLSFSEIALPGLRSTGRWSDAAYRRAALRTGLGLPSVDLCFAHFLYPSGRRAARPRAAW
jgi:hypothetical protein